MRKEEPGPQDQDWERIRAAFLRAPARPSRQETEAFVCRVMGRLQDEPPRVWTALRWLVPAMSFALAFSAFLIARPDPSAIPPDDVALLASGSGLTPQAAPPSTAELAAVDTENE